MSNNELMKPEVSVRIVRCAVVYFEQHYGTQALQEVLASVGDVSAEYLEDENNWVSQHYLEDLLDKMTEVSGRADFSYQAGLYQSRPEVMPIARGFILALGSPAAMYEVVFGTQRQVSLANRVGVFEIEDKTPNSLRIAYRPIRPELRERNNNLHDFRRGQISSLTRIFSLKPAEVVEHTVLPNRSGSRYVFRWESRTSKVEDTNKFRWGGLGVGIVAAAACWLGLHSLVGVVLCLVFLPLFGLLWAQRVDDSFTINARDAEIDAKQEQLHQAENSFRLANTRIEERNARLELAKASIEERNATLEVANETLKAAHADLDAKNQELARALANLDEKNRELATLNSTLEERVAERTQRLEEANRLKDDFFASINHELRTPLTLILTPLGSLLERPDSLTTEQVALFRGMLANSLRLLKLINDLLDLSKLGAGKARLRYQEIDLNEKITSIVDRFRPTADEAGLGLTLSLAPQLPVVVADSERLDQILYNLLSNAVKFTPTGGTITVSSEADPEGVRFSVQDTGQGIPEEMQPRIFDRFGSGSNRAVRGYGGSGLGLSLVKQVVDLHEGRVELRSKEGVGTTFTIHLPLGERHVREDRAERRKPGGGRPADVSPRRIEDHALSVEAERLVKDAWSIHMSDFQAPGPESLPELPSHAPDRSTLLLVDDRAEVLQVLVHLLRDKYNLVTASDGVEGFQKALDHRPDLVISDVVMPHRNGYELCHDIKNDPRTAKTPVILLSAKAEEEDFLDQAATRARGINTHGADDFLSKPFNSAELNARVSARLRLRQMEEDLRRKNEELKEKADQLHLLATTDGLTGLLNRREFDKRLAEQFERATNERREMAIVMFDIDHFRAVNNSFGHPDGDVVLAQVARDTLVFSQNHGFAGRYGGEEFILCFPGWTQGRALAWAEDLLRLIRGRTYLVHHPEHQVTISAGVAAFPMHPVTSPGALVKLADDVLLEAKEAGRNRVFQALPPPIRLPDVAPAAAGG